MHIVLCTGRHSSNHTPRFPYRPPSSTSLRTRAGTYRAATGFLYSRPTTATSGLRGTTRPPPPTPTTSTAQQGPGGNRQSGNSRSSCDICSFSQKPAIKKKVYHEHFSSKSLRELLDVELALSGSYFCPSCKTQHSPYPTERTKIVLSDSTLHNFCPSHPHQDQLQWRHPTCGLLDHSWRHLRDYFSRI